MLSMCVSRSSRSQAHAPASQHVASAAAEHEQSRCHLQVAKPQKPPQVLQGNAGEVTGVAWCSTDPTQIVTCHDNATVNVWTLDRSRDAAAKDLVRSECSSLFAPLLTQTAAVNTLVRIRKIALGVAQQKMWSTQAPPLAEPGMGRLHTITTPKHRH